MSAKLESLGRLTVVMESGGFMADFQQCSITMLQSQKRVRLCGACHLYWTAPSFKHTVTTIADANLQTSQRCVASIYFFLAQLFFSSIFQLSLLFLSIDLWNSRGSPLNTFPILSLTNLIQSLLYISAYTSWNVSIVFILVFMQSYRQQANKKWRISCMSETLLFRNLAATVSLPFSHSSELSCYLNYLFFAPFLFCVSVSLSVIQKSSTFLWPWIRCLIS